MKKIIIPIVCSLAMLLASCNQNLLEIPQKGVVTTATFYQTDADAEAAMVAAYQGFIWNVCSQEGGSTYSPYRQAFNQCGDDLLAAGEFWGDNDHIFCMNEFRHDSSCNPSGLTYKNIYYAMYYCNLVIDKFKDGLPDGTKTAVTKRVVAEAKVLRAWMHMTLAIGWGTPPLVDHILSPADLPFNCDIDPVNPKTHEELLKWCAAECEEAYPDLDERQSPQDKDGAVKVTKGFAKAVAGKSLLFAGDYAGAKTALQAVISSKKYELVPGSKYADLFHIEGDANEEKIFEANVQNNSSMAGMPWEGNPSIMNRTTWMESNLWNWRSDHFVANPNTAYSSIDGWGGLGVPESFAKEFVENDGLDSYRLKGSIIPIESVVYEMSYPGLKDDSGKAVDEMTLDEKKTCKAIGIGTKGLYGQSMYLALKPITRTADLKNPGNNLRMNNFTIMRYAEVLLMAAEACLQTNDATTAKTYINMIQERAGSKTVSATVDMNVLKREKKLELWLEGCRWPDIVRWKDFDGLKTAGKNIPELWDAMHKDGEAAHRFYITHTNPSDAAGVPYGFNAEKHVLFPFPQDVCDINPNLRQNPGW